MAMCFHFNPPTVVSSQCHSKEADSRVTSNRLLDLYTGGLILL